MDNNKAVKRALDEDVEVNVKRLKTDDLPTPPPIEKIQNVRDPRKWSQLPSVVLELLTLLKQSEKCNSQKEYSDEKLENISDIEKKELLVLPNENNGCVQNSDEKHNTEFLCTVESNKLSTFKSTVENSIQSIKFNFFNNESENVEVQNNISLNTKITPVQNIEHNCLQKVEQKEDEAHEETSDTPTKSVSLTKTCMTSLSESIHSTSTNMVSAQPASLINNTISSTIISIPESISAQTPLMCASKKNISNIVVSTSSESIASMAINNSITTTSNTKSVSSNPITTIVCDMPVSTPLKSEKKDILETSRREQIFNLLQIHCLNSISVVPTTKPPPCICQYCKHVDNLPIGKSALNNKCAQFINNKNLNTDMYSSDVAASDCSEPSKDIWVNELCSLIRKNDELHKVPVSNTNCTSNTMTSIKNVIKKVTQKIKPLLPFCNNCKKPKHDNSSVCYNCNPPFKNIYEHYDTRSGNKSYFTKHGNRRYKYY